MPKRQYCELEGQLTCLRLVHFHLQASHGKCHRARLASDLRPKWCVQWKRSVTLDDIVKLLGDVRGFVDIPQQVQSAQEAKVYHHNYKSLTVSKWIYSAKLYSTLTFDLHVIICQAI